jgi:hypothetical protein
VVEVSQSPSNRQNFFQSFRICGKLPEVVQKLHNLFNRRRIFTMQNQNYRMDQKFPGLAGENLVPISQAGKEFPKNCSPSGSTIQRLWREGCRGNKLETLLLGGRRFTSVEAIQRFVERSLDLPENDDALCVPNNPSENRSTESVRKKFNLPPSGKNGRIAK